MQKKILNFGSLNVDYTYQVKQILKPGETQSSLDMDIFLGGKGFNQSVALAKAGVSVFHAGMIGEDGSGFLDACDEYGIDRTCIRQMSGKGGHTIIQVDENGQNCILLYGGTNRQIDKTFVDQVLETFEEGDYLLLQNEISELGYIIDRAYEKGMCIILNPSPFDSHLDSCDMSKVSYFLLNEIEGEQMTGYTEPEDILQVLLEKYPKAKIVLTLGSESSVYAEQGICVKQPIYKVKAVDTTAAGDTFTGYFIAGLLEGLSIEDNLNRCACASAITVTRNGASPSIPYKDEVELMMKR